MRTTRSQARRAASRLTRVLSAALLAAWTLVSSGCADGVAYDTFARLGDAVWDKDTLAVFRADIADTVGVYDVYVQVRNDNDYAFSNLWLFIDVISPDGRMRRDTLECTLARPDGSWLGGGWGSLYTLRRPYIAAARFARPGPYTFRLTQGMRKDQLRGIHDIGLLIERHEQRE